MTTWRFTSPTRVIEVEAPNKQQGQLKIQEKIGYWPDMHSVTEVREEQEETSGS